MEYVLLFFFGWMVVCLPAIIVTAVANGRRRRETAELNDKITSLTRQLEALERRIRVDAAHVAEAAPAVDAVPAMKISEQETRAAVRPGVSPIAEHKQPAPKEPAPWVSAPPPPPPSATPAPSVPSLAAQTQQTHPPPKPVDVGGLPMTPPHRP